MFTVGNSQLINDYYCLVIYNVCMTMKQSRVKHGNKIDGENTF